MNQGSGSGVIERNQRSAEPVDGLADVGSQVATVGFHQLGRREGDHSKCDNPAWIENGDQTNEMLRAVVYLVARGRAVTTFIVARVAQDGVRQENILTRKSRRPKEAIERSAGAVPRQGHAQAVCPQAPRRLSDEKDARVNRSVGLA